MPYKLQKTGAGYVVINSETGHPHSKKPLSRTRAKAQMRALYANVPDAAKAAAEDTAPAPSGGRKKMTPAERARHASLVRWGKEQPFAARLEQVKERRRKAKLAKAKGGKGKGKGAKPKAAAPTPEQQEAEAEKQRQANVSAVGSALDNADNEAMSSRGLAALDGARKGEEPPGPMADGLIKGGFAERGADGRFRLTPEGRALMRAADKGDEQAALDAISRASDRSARNAEREQRKVEQEQRKAEREKAKSKGGGGKKEKAKPAKEEAADDADEPLSDEETAYATAAEVGLSEGTVRDLRDAADEGNSNSDELREMGFIDEDGDATPEAVNALDALERGDARGYRRAVRSARARKRREERQSEREGAREKARKERGEQRTKEEAQRQTQRAERERAVQERSKENQDKRVAAEVERIAAARARKTMDDEIEVKQTASERAMFANMGSSGSGGGGGGGGGKPTGGTGGLWKKGPDGKRTPQAGMETPKKKDDGDSASTTSAKPSKPAATEHPQFSTEAQGRIHEGVNRAGLPVLPHSNSSADDFGGRQAVVDKLSTLSPQQLRAMRSDVSEHTLEMARGKGQFNTPDVRRSMREDRDYQHSLIDDALAKAKGKGKDDDSNSPFVGLPQDLTKTTRAQQRALVDKHVSMSPADLRKQQLLNREQLQMAREQLSRTSPGDPAYDRLLRGQENLMFKQGIIMAAQDKQEREARRATKKSIEDLPMSDLTPVIEDLETLLDEALEITDADDAVKAGRRNSTADQATIDQGYELSMQLCELFESLGATVDDEEDEAEEEVEGEEVEMLEGKAARGSVDEWVDTYSNIPELLDRCFAINGDAVKALDGDRVGALAVRFGSADEPDMSVMRDYFTKSTDFWIDAWDRRPMLYHHAMDEDTSDAPRIGTWTKAEVKDEGVWLEGQLDKSHRYYTAIKELIKRGALRLSSDSAPHLVRREAKGSTHEVTRWPLLAASLTPTPAEPRLTAVSFKAMLAEYGLNDIENNPEAEENAERERQDAAKALADRQRRLLLELELATLEATTL